MSSRCAMINFGERFRWVRSYFAAKSREFAAAGYPPDASGLLPESDVTMERRL
jgi:hypothetical protein